MSPFDFRVMLRAVQAAANGILVTDRKGIIEWVNPAFTRLTGYTEREAVGQSPRFLKSGLQPESLYAEMWSTILAGNTWTGELKNRRKDGSLYTEEMTITPVVEAGEITHFIAVKQDITELRRKEEQFLQAQKMEAVGRLAGGVAHDFNNILTAILGYCSLLQLSFEASDPKLADIEAIQGAARRASDLTRQLLAFSRRQVLAPRAMDLNQVPKNLEKMLHRLIGEDVRLRVSASTAPCGVRADPGQMEQVLMNLVVNARDAMPHGGVVTVETRCVRFSEDSPGRHDMIPAGDYAVLAVSDTGVGMDPETQAHIFEPFFTTKEKGKGTGLGLSTVYGIVKQSGGYLWVYSEPGKGTAIKVYLPSLRDPVVAEEAAPAVIQGCRSGKLLVVEDDQAVRRLLVRILERAGYEVADATNGSDALELFRLDGEGIQLVLTDLVMPRMGGREFAERLRGFRPDVPVVFMSGYTDDAIIRLGELGPGAAYLQKPISPHDLIRTVEGLLGQEGPEG